jgi:hypothetical protein
MLGAMYEESGSLAEVTADYGACSRPRLLITKSSKNIHRLTLVQGRCCLFVFLIQVSCTYRCIVSKITIKETMGAQ